MKKHLAVLGTLASLSAFATAQVIIDDVNYAGATLPNFPYTSATSSNMLGHNWTTVSSYFLADNSGTSGFLQYDSQKPGAEWAPFGGAAIGSIKVEAFFPNEPWFPVTTFLPFTLRTSNDGVTWTPVAFDNPSGTLTGVGGFSGGGITWQRIDFVKTGLNSRFVEIQYNLSSSGDNYATHIDRVTFEAVPEPMTMSLLALGAAAVAARRRKNKS
ncbi:MAG: PEP-CTERM sorting domain-containing protein [Fimbriimonadaceae bacterium]|jgi:hypothetical protein|nr:PEP-CTERM sorting domain-containing protein [Fimbriimonadaceae bacterium]